MSSNIDCEEYNPSGPGSGERMIPEDAVGLGRKKTPRSSLHSLLMECLHFKLLIRDSGGRNCRVRRFPSYPVYIAIFRLCQIEM